MRLLDIVDVIAGYWIVVNNVVQVIMFYCHQIVQCLIVFPITPGSKAFLLGETLGEAWAAARSFANLNKENIIV